MTPARLRAAIAWVEDALGTDERDAAGRDALEVLREVLETTRAHMVLECRRCGSGREVSHREAVAMARFSWPQCCGGTMALGPAEVQTW